MRSIQEYFKEADKEQLINAYLYAHPINLWDVKDSESTIEELKERVRKRLDEYTERLRTMQIKKGEDDKIGVFFVHKTVVDGYPDDEVSLVHLDELEKDGIDAQTYAYELTKQCVIMGWLVSDAPYTQEHILKLLVDVMYEASFFGYRQEELDKEIEKLEESIRQAKVGQTYSMEEVFEDLGIEREERDEQADTLLHKITEDIMAFYRYNRQKELSALMRCEQ